ncbi:MAG: electron transfer flavoprotein subunit beta/FixA family protein [Legionellales bacterium]|nr:electron transfer flavoprotein subunit beta/FixA family protein [Legionellales bacterium]
MKMFVPIKRVIDPYVNIQIKPDGSGVVTQNVKMAINTFDEIAIEQAIQFKEQQLADEVILVSIGDSSVNETLRAGLALGADRALWVDVGSAVYEPLNIAKILQVLVQREAAELVLMGKQSIDGDHNQTGQMLAGLLAWPQATFASKIVLQPPHALVTREVDGGLETLKVTLPAVITTDLRLNEPRYATLPNIMQAKRKPITKVTLDDLQLDLKSHRQLLNISSPPVRRAGAKVRDVVQLIDKLRNEAKVID